MTVGAACALLPAAAGAEPMGFEVRQLDLPRTVSSFWQPTVQVVPGPAGATTIYLTGHATGVGTRGPAYVSRDDGTTWAALPTASGAPTDASGGEPHMAADDRGRAWLVDGIGATMPLYGFCGYGTELCEYRPDIYPHGAAAAGCPEPAEKMEVIDRQWAAYAGGMLMLVNNDAQFLDAERETAENTAQVAFYDVGRGEAPSRGAIRWQPCGPSGYFPGVPSGRARDRTFALPQVKHPAPLPGEKRELHVHVGSPEQFLDDTTRDVPLFELGPSNSLSCEVMANWGFAGYSASGTLYVAGAPDDGRRDPLPEQATALAVAAIGRDGEPVIGRLRADSLDGKPGFVTFLWLAANPRGEGAALVYGMQPDCGEPVTFLVRHLSLQGGAVVFGDEHRINVVPLEGAGGDLMGAAVGPDGRTYLATWSGALSAPWLENPANAADVSLFRQTSGPRLPAASPAAERPPLVRITLVRSRPGRRGLVARVRVACRSSAPCTARARLLPRNRRAAPPLATARAIVPGGKQASITLRLPRRIVARIARAGAVRARVLVTARARGGPPVTVSRRVTLRARGS